jgi:hypothetical protein
MPDLDLQAAFEGFRVSAFRLCARDFYDVDSERAALAVWRDSGEVIGADDGWPELVAARVGAGAAMSRVHVFSRPLGEYSAWLLRSLPRNVAAGERVAVGYRDEMPLDLVGVADDFWLFDDTTVALMRYDSAGRFLGAADASAQLDYYRGLRDRLQAGASALNGELAA